MGSTGPVEYERAENIAWRLAPDRVLVVRVDGYIDIGATEDSTCADLLGPAALVWVAAEHASTVVSLAADTDLEPNQVDEAVEVLLEAGWLIATAGSTDAHR